jgi:hypothetical protein
MAIKIFSVPPLAVEVRNQAFEVSHNLTGVQLQVARLPTEYRLDLRTKVFE